MAVSETDLHAYVDGELTGAQFNRVSNEVLSSKKLFDHVCDLQALKHLFRQAYETVPIPHSSDPTAPVERKMYLIHDRSV